MTSKWRSMKLGDICEIQRGGSPRPIEKYITTAANGVNWIKIGDVPEGAKYIYRTAEKIIPEGVRSSRQVFDGDFLLSNSMSFGRPYILRTSGCIHDGWLCLRYDKDVLSEDYLYHALGSNLVYNQFKLLAVGAVVKNLNSEVVRRVEIPVPPFPEQQRIATILDKAQDLIFQRKQSLEKVGGLSQSLFAEMFGDPISNTKGLDITNLIDLVDPDRPVTYGILMPGNDVPDGVKYVRVVDMKNGGIDHESVRRTTEEISNSYKRSLLMSGDLLISIRGHVGRLAIVPKELEGANITQDSARLAIKRANPVYVRECLRMPSFQEWMRRRTKGAAVKGINLADVKVMPIPTPSRTLQEQFAKRVLRAEMLLDKQRHSLSQFESLFDSLQHRALRGQL